MSQTFPPVILRPATLPVVERGGGVTTDPARLAPVRIDRDHQRHHRLRSRRVDRAAPAQLRGERPGSRRRGHRRDQRDPPCHGAERHHLGARQRAAPVHQRLGPAADAHLLDLRDSRRHTHQRSRPARRGRSTTSRRRRLVVLAVQSEPVSGLPCFRPITGKIVLIHGPKSALSTQDTPLVRIAYLHESLNPGTGEFARSITGTASSCVQRSATGRSANAFELGRAWPLPDECLGIPRREQRQAGAIGRVGLHPTVKPVEMIVDAIKDCSKRGGIILDPFGGSGSTLIAAAKTGRPARLAELDPVYVDRPSGGGRHGGRMTP